LDSSAFRGIESRLREPTAPTRISQSRPEPRISDRVSAGCRNGSGLIQQTARDSISLCSVPPIARDAGLAR